MVTWRASPSSIMVTMTTMSVVVSGPVAITTSAVTIPVSVSVLTVSIPIPLTLALITVLVVTSLLPLAFLSTVFIQAWSFVLFAILVPSAQVLFALELFGPETESIGPSLDFFYCATGLSVPAHTSEKSCAEFFHWHCFVVVER
ncbi:hypothetical protein HG530_014012 [Fusarium avenaceum]|nr:hypothetical protein HG530_014012 [Fusarium avenaceum]